MSSLRKKTEVGSSQPSGRSVTVHYDRDVDAMTIIVSKNPVARTVKTRFGLVDLDNDEGIVAIEVFAASKMLARARRGEPAEPEPSLDDELRSAVTRYVDEARETVDIA